MSAQTDINQDYIAQIEDLRARLDEAEETLRAIHSGEVDALVVAGPQGNQIYTLKGAESTYRVLVEAMSEGALVLTPDGTVMYSNSAFADMVDVPLEQVIGSRIQNFVHEHDLENVDDLLIKGKQSDCKRELALKNETKEEPVPTQISIGKLPTEAEGMSAVVTDLTETKRTEAELQIYREHLEELVDERTKQLQKVSEELKVSNEELCVTNEELQEQIKERERAEEAAKVSEEHYRSLYETSLDAILITNIDGTIYSANPAAQAMFGMTEEEISGAGRDGLIDPQDDRLYPIINERKSKKRARGLLTYVRKDGSKFEGEMTSVILSSQNRAYVIIRDMTERIQAEKTLQASKERIKTVLESITDGYYALDNEWRFMEMNRATELHFRNFAEALNGKVIWDITSTPENSTIYKKFHKAVSTQKIIHFEIESEFQPGNWSEIHLYPRDGILEVYFRDITKRKQAEEALKESESLLRAVMEGTSDPIYVKDIESRIIMCNPALSEVVGKPLEDIIGKTYAEYYDDSATGQMLRENDLQIISSGESLTIEETIVTSIGSRTFLSSKTPYCNASGKIIGITGISHDITERKRGEDELNKLNRTLTALSSSSRAMMHIQNEQEYLAEVCRIVVEDCGHAMVWIGYTENDESKSVHPAAYSGFEERYLETLELTWADTERGHGPTGTAIRTGKPSLCRNMLTDPCFGPWREEALKRGYASSIVLPLAAHGDVFGALTIYSREPDPFSESEIKFLTELANDLAYGITTIRLRADREHTEEELRKSEEHFRLALNHSPVSVAVQDRNLVYQWAYNQQIRQPNEIIGKTDADLFAPEDAARILTIKRKVLESGIAVHVEQWLVSNGKRLYLDLHYEPTRNNAGEITGIGIAVIDLTNQKRAEEALRESEKRYHNLFSELIEGFCIIEVIFDADNKPIDYRFLEVNPAFENQTGLHNALGQTIQELSPGQEAHWFDTYGKVALTGQPIRFMEEAKALNRWFDVSAYRIGDADSRKVAILFNDITLAKNAEVQLEGARDLLVNQVQLLQQALIPPTPAEINGYHVASVYIPAYVGTEIGGDFLDIFNTENGKVGILIGDVSGKGIEAAAMAAITRSTIRAFTYESSQSGYAMDRTNSLLSTQSDYPQFVTAFLAILDPITGTINYSSAGHPPAIVSSANGDITQLYTHNLALGIMDGAEYIQSSHTLKPGDKLVLYTDGITEARHDNVLFGTEGLESVLETHGLTPVDELITEIVSAAKEWGNDKLQDDTALIVVSRE